MSFFRLSSLNAKFALGFSGAAALVMAAGLVVGTSSMRLGEALQSIQESGAVQRRSALADMFHDAVRSEVYVTLYEVTKGAGQKDEALAALAKDAEELVSNLKQAAEGDHSESAREAFRKADPLVTAYLDQAKRVVVAAFENLAAADVETVAFNERFKDLETALDSLGDVLEEHSRAVEADAQASRSRAQLLTWLAAAGILALMLAAGAWLARFVVRPIRDLAQTLTRIREGSAEIDIPAMDRADEIGTVARAVDRIASVGRDNRLTVSAVNYGDTMMMITDREERIVFISEKLTDFMMRYENVFRAARNDFSVEKMSGHHIDYYRANPNLKRTLILDDGKMRKVKYELGGATVLVDMTYVHDVGGGVLGHTLIWRDVTQELLGQAEVAQVVDAAQQGDFSARLALENKDGFVREIANGLNNVSSLVQKAVEDCAGVMGDVAHGDLTRRVTADYHGQLGALKDSINDTIERLSTTVSTIQATAQDVTSAAQEISSGANDLASRTEQQASALEQTAATTEELAASVKSSAQASRKGVEMAEDAKVVAEQGGGIVRDAVEAMTRIEQASKRISDISSVIDEIAFQTNLLALNAAVEAARAGDAGKGFAVVASEVRTLAQRSSDAAKDITNLINSSTAEVETGVKLVRSAGEVLGQMVDASRRVSSTIAEISSASGEQAAGIDEMSQAVAHMDEMTQQNAALAEESAASANALSAQIRELNELVSSFRIRNEAWGAREPGRSRTGRAA